jgi:hypothetical protein
MFKETHPCCSKLTLPDLDLLAYQTRLVIRKSDKFSPSGFLQSLIGSTVTGFASYNQIAASLKDRVPKSMSRQSMYERFDTCSTAFLVAVHSNLMQQRYTPVVTKLEGSGVGRVVVEDSTSHVMPKANADMFPAHGNRYGCTAGVKIDFAFDLISGTIISHSLQLATEQDKTIGKELVAEIKRGDLVLRDMGYFSLNEFTAIEDRDAWWLTRLPLNTGVKLENRESLEKVLKRSRHNTVDLAAIVGAQGKKCRLIAMRAEQKVTEARRRERRAKAKKCGKQPCPKGLIRDGWHLMITNLEQDRVSADQLTAVYRARWAVEIQFRAWKQALNLGKALNRTSNEHHMQALVLAAMIFHQLGMKIAQQIRDQVGRARLSYENLYDQLAAYLVKISDFAEVANFDPDLRHIRRDKRGRQSPVESGISALT